MQNVLEQIAKANHDLAEMLTAAMRPMPNELFHYTDTSGLTGIMGGGQFHATHFKFLNDFTEVQYGIDIGLEALAEIREANTEPLFEKSAATVIRSREAMKQLGGVEYDVYLASFSEDGDLLSQWRGYGREGRGYSLGFDPARLRHDQLPVTLETRLQFIKVIYDPEAQKRIARDSIEAIRQPLQGLPDDDTTADVMSAAAATMNRILFHLALTYKAPGFREEREWRAVAVRMLSGIKMSEDVQFRITGDDQLVPYVKLDLRTEAEKRLPLTRIICGPRHDFDQARLSLLMMARKQGYPTSKNPDRTDRFVVERSATSFR